MMNALLPAHAPAQLLARDFIGAYVPAYPKGPSRMPLFLWVGTGGLETERLFLCHIGYEPPAVRLAETGQAAQPLSPYARLMQEVKAGFGRTVSRLPEVFGVSRQTLYNWLNGETPKPAHHDKLRELAAAARVFSELQFKLTSAVLDKTVANGKSLLELVSEGAPGAEAAHRLVRIARRGAEERARLDALLGPRNAPRPEISDMGSPSLAEE